MRPDRNSLLNSILHQIYAPSAYQADIFRMQIVVHMVKYADEFMRILDKFLEQKNLGLIDHMFGVAHGEIWGDEYMIAAISHMWNISISMISPGYSREWKIFYDRELAHIYVIGNGYRFQVRQKESLLRRHYNIGVILSNLEESLAVCRKTITVLKQKCTNAR